MTAVPTVPALSTSRLLRWLAPGLAALPAVLGFLPAASAAEPVTVTSPALSSTARHTFVIGEQDFLLDGKPFVIRCGEIHFPRVPREYWKHRLQMCRAMGLNTVCVYLFWNFHEWQEGTYNWSGAADVAEFCRLAQAEGLWVILRPGPYSCAEWEMGGLPWWLVKQDGIQLRSTDPRFLEPATRYLREVGRVLGPQQITRGGPLLMVQVENEYGSYGDDPVYMGALRQALLDGGFDVPLFACNPEGAISKGYRSDLFQVVNFGIGNAKRSFETLRKFQKTGPLMNGEYYPAWFDVWGRKHATGAAEPIAKDLDYMLTHKHSFSIYMAHGGTSFGLWAGADRPFLPDTSSYDYDAPISEAGWRTPKFDAIRDVFAKHLLPGETLTEPPPANPVITLPAFTLKETAPVLSNLPAPKTDTRPKTMEFYGQSRGMTVYSTILPGGPAGELRMKAVHDFAWVYLDGEKVGVLDRRSQRYKIALPAHKPGARLELVLEAMGRVNFGKEVFDRKGLHGPVEFVPSTTQQPQEVLNWKIHSFELDGTTLAGLTFRKEAAEGPAFWRGSFELTKTGDTFLDVRTWTKGVVWINGHCIGRFWNIGPTQTMYVPGPWLKEGTNEIIVLDLIGPEKPELSGLAKPILDVLRPELDFARPERAKGTFTVPSGSSAGTGSLKPEAEWQTVTFTKPVTGRYLAFEVKSSHGNSPHATIAELDALDAKGDVASKALWKVLWVSSEETFAEAGNAEHLLDGQPNTHWHSLYTNTSPKPPHRVVVDMGASVTVSGIRYLARAGDVSKPGRVKDFDVYVSDQSFGLTAP